MDCYSCGTADADETCAKCDNWICEECVREYEGEFVCPQCYEIIYEDQMQDFQLSDVGDGEDES